MALIPPRFLDCVVAIGIPLRDGSTHWCASGFIYGTFIDKITEEENTYRTYLVTNRHVLEKFDTVCLLFNPENDEPAREFTVSLRPLGDTPSWVAHPDPEVDVAVMPINITKLRQQNIRFHIFEDHLTVADRAKAKELGITEGDGVYTLGFPMGLVGEERNFVIVRSGTIARIRDALAGSSKKFLIDSHVFQGSSGGPVILKPEITAIQGTNSQRSAYLIGIVEGYIPYTHEEEMQEEDDNRKTFKENSGLASIFLIDRLTETIEEARRIVPKDR